MDTRTVSLFQIVTHTPLWVWPILAYVVFVGVRRMSDRVVSLWRLALLPAVALAFASAHLFSGDLSPARLAGFFCGAVLGAATGYAVSRRRPARLREDGKLAIRGDWLPLALMLGIFAIRYAQGIALGVDPSLGANPVFAVAGDTLSGLFAAMMVARTLGQLPAELFRRATVALSPIAKSGRDRA